jgi:hypothetical protein
VSENRTNRKKSLSDDSVRRRQMFGRDSFCQVICAIAPCSCGLCFRVRAHHRVVSPELFGFCTISGQPSVRVCVCVCVLRVLSRSEYLFYHEQKPNKNLLIRQHMVVHRHRRFSETRRYKVEKWLGHLKISASATRRCARTRKRNSQLRGTIVQMTRQKPSRPNISRRRTRRF